jgi:sugar phosphate isomerase/epimerase
MSGGSARFIRVNNFDEWYDKDFTRDYYYLDLDKKYRYIAAAGFQGIELFWFDIPTLQAKFGKRENFTECLNDRSIEKVTGCYGTKLGA